MIFRTIGVAWGSTSSNKSTAAIFEDGNLKSGVVRLPKTGGDTESGNEMSKHRILTRSTKKINSWWKGMGPMFGMANTGLDRKPEMMRVNTDF
jgi:hypothetical protein